MPNLRYKTWTETTPAKLDDIQFVENHLMSDDDHTQIATNKAHLTNTDNPHAVTAAQVGLGNVDNTSDANKPVSTAQKEYIDTADEINASNIAPAYSSSSTYALGTLCVRGNILYKCTTAITTSEAWNSAHWTQTTIGDSIQNGGGAGHTIVDAFGNEMPQEKKLQFTGTGVTSVTDDSTNGKTVVTISGEKGDAATVTVGTTTTGDAGTSASVTNSGTTSAAVLNFTIPRGNTGATGATPTVAVGTTTTGAAGTSASVTNTGTSTAAVFNFTIPQGAKGDSGDAASITAGSTTTLPAGSSATVTNSGTTGAAVFNFGIPKGADGTGSGTITAVITTSPIAGGGTTGDVTISHATSGVTAGTYKSVTVNDTGHVTAGTNPTTLAGYGITDAVSTTGTAAKADQLATARTIAISGGATGTATSFDGTENISIPVTSLDATKLTGTASIDTTGNAATATTATDYAASGGIATAFASKQDTLTAGTNVTLNGATISVTDAMIFLASHPVGCYYWTSNSTNPGTLYGGTWKAFADKFMLGAGTKYTAASTGGAEEHYHTLPILGNTTQVQFNNLQMWNGLVASNATGGGSADGATGTCPNRIKLTGTPEATAVTAPLLGSFYSSSMPPYEAEYCWHRTA